MDGEEVFELGTDPLDPEPDPVPEPSACLMLIAGAAFLGALNRRRKTLLHLAGGTVEIYRA